MRNKISNKIVVFAQGLKVLQIFLAPKLVGILLVIAFFMSGDVFAQREKNNSENKPRRSSQVLSASVSKKMTSARDDLIAEKYPAALEKLNVLLSRGERLREYDKAKVLEMMVNVYLGLEDYKNATIAAEQALDLGVLEGVSFLQLNRLLVTLYMNDEKYDLALNCLEAWLKSGFGLEIQDYFTVAHVYIMADQMEEALVYAEQGMAELSKQTEIVPKENWYRLIATVYLNLKKYESASQVLEQAITYWPHQANYYLQLVGVYQTLNRGEESFVVLSLAYQNNLLTAESNINHLLQMYRYYDYPYKGARIFEYEMRQDIIKQSETAWKELSHAWLQGREWGKAEQSLRYAAKLSETGEHWLRLCQISFQEERWSDSKVLCKNALKKSNLNKDEGAAWYLLALIQYYQDDMLEASKAFDQCKAWVKTEEDCDRWYSHVSKIIQDREEEEKNLRAMQEENRNRMEDQQKSIDEAFMMKNDVVM